MERPGDKEAKIEEVRIEEWVLTNLGYGYRLDTPISEKSTIQGRNFLDAYGQSPHRQDTEDLLLEFKDMEPTDPDYEATKNYIMRFLQAQFGPPINEDNNS
jgi:hypothetical protein